MAHSRFCGLYIADNNGAAMKVLDEAKIKVGSAMEGGIKRMGALFLKVQAVPMVPVGLGFMLYGLFQILNSNNPKQFAPFAIGVTLTILGSLLWVLAKKLDAAAHLVRYRRQQNRVVRLAQQRGGRLTVTETAADTGLTVEEAGDILKRMAEGGFVEIEITDSGMIVYRFPEVLLAHEKHWSRGVESA
jgi:hypothetical protein